LLYELWTAKAKGAYLGTQLPTPGGWAAHDAA